MENSFALCLLLMTALLVNDATSAELHKEKLREMTAQMLADCRAKVGASEEDLKMIKEKHLPTTPEGICLIECMFDVANIMKNGNLYKQGAVQAFTPGMEGNQGKIDKMKNMIDTCDKELKKDTDKCKNAKAIVECIAKYGKEFDFKFPTHIR